MKRLNIVLQINIRIYLIFEKNINMKGKQFNQNKERIRLYRFISNDI